MVAILLVTVGLTLLAVAVLRKAIVLLVATNILRRHVDVGIGAIPLLLLALHAARELPGVDDHGDEHEEGIKDVQRPLVREEVAVLATNVLNDTDDGSDQNQDAHAVQHVQDFLPSRVGVHGGARGVATHAQVEDEGGDGEEAKEADLDEQTNQNHILGQVGVLDGRFLGCEHGASDDLDEEGEDVAHDEEGRQPARGDERGAFTVDAANQTAHDHVDGGGEEGGRDEDQDRLEDEGHELPGSGIGGCAGGITNSFDCGMLVMVNIDLERVGEEGKGRTNSCYYKGNRVEGL